jgi:hypothetical protein
MAAGGAGRGGLGWAILAAALAVPGFLFYNWWSHLKVDRDHALSAKAIKRADGGVFQTPPPMTGRLVNPMASSTSAPAGFPPAAAPRPSAMPAAAAPGRTILAAAAPAGTMPAGRMLAGPASLAASAGKPPAAEVSAAAAVSTNTTVVLSRDPMMSPMDVVRLQEAALAEEDRQRALAASKSPRSRHSAKHVQGPIETRIELQGISSTSDGDNFAMISDSRVSAGESFRVANYPGKVKVLKISESEVTFDYQGRRFKMKVNAE